MVDSNARHPRETREGWPLLTVETEANGDSMSTRVLPWLVRWARRAGTRYVCPALAALVGHIQNTFFSSPYTISIHLSPSPSKLSRQSCRVTCLLICVSCQPLLIASICTTCTCRTERRETEREVAIVAMLDGGGGETNYNDSTKIVVLYLLFHS